MELLSQASALISMNQVGFLSLEIVYRKARGRFRTEADGVRSFDDIDSSSAQVVEGCASPKSVVGGFFGGRRPEKALQAPVLGNDELSHLPFCRRCSGSELIASNLPEMQWQ